MFSWIQSTFVFYIGLMMACYIISMVLMPARIKIYVHRHKNACIFVPLMLLLFVKGFALCGADLVGGYKANFESALSMEAFRDQSLEVGYRLINVVVRNITSNYSVLVFILAVLTIWPIIYVFKKYRSIINIPVAILMYGAIFFLPGISLIRIYLASSICMLSFDALYEKKYLKAVLFVFVASTIHITALIMLIPCLCFLFKVDRKVFVLTILFAIVMLYIGRGAINYFLSGRYAVYSVSGKIHIGTEWIWFYGPLILLYFYVLKSLIRLPITSNLGESIRMFRFSSIWIWIGFFISMAQYAFNIFGRLVAFTLPLVLFVASGLHILRMISIKKYKLVLFIAILYIILRFIIYISGYYVLDGIMPYINCFGWEI